MKNIHTLIPDIQEILKTKGWFTGSIPDEFTEEITVRLAGQFNRDITPPTLRLSQMGPRCPCELWHMINKPDLAEPMPPWAEMKFSFGHIMEGLAIALAKAAGHDVTGEQDVIYVDGVAGHRDCVVDGCIVDVKSASSRAFQKFKDGSIKNDDPFGYLDQLDGYLVGSCSDSLVTVKDRAYLLAIDKQLGHMVLYEHYIREDHIRDRISRYKQIVGSPTPPRCTCGTVPEGKSGNIKLDMRASYNSFKWSCKPDLRCFLYATGPVYLTKVVRFPNVPEIDKFGNIIGMP